MRDMLQRLLDSLNNNVKLDMDEGMIATIKMEDYFVVLGIVKHLLDLENEDLEAVN